jgi:carbon-monoxide dehydrogenase medium subunit
MKPPLFAYHDPTTIDEAVDLIGRLDNAIPLAGGQSLMPMLNFRVVAPDHLIDLNRIKALSFIRIDSGAGHFGPMTRQRELEFSPDVKSTFPIISEAIRNVGHRQTRNRGTFGGSLCHLDPSAELVNMAVLHDGVLVVRKGNGTREIKSTDWSKGIMTNALDPGEILTSIELGAWPKGHGFAFEEFARRHGDFAITAVGCLVTLETNGTIHKTALCLSGTGPAPIRVAKARACSGCRAGCQIRFPCPRSRAAGPAARRSAAESTQTARLAIASANAPWRRWQLRRAWPETDRARAKNCAGRGRH